MVSHPTNTKVKYMSQSHSVITFLVGYPFLPINLDSSPALTTHGMCDVLMTL